MWFPLALATACCAAASDALCKKALEKSRVATVAWVRAAWGSLFLIPAVFFAPTISDPRAFWTSIAMALPLEVAAALIYQRALRVSPLSLSVPYLAFSPVFLLGIGWVILGEKPTAWGAVGVLLVAAGAIYLQLQGGGAGYSLFGVFPIEKGSLLVLAAAFLYAITASLAKKALLASSPLIIGGIYFPLFAL